MSENEGRARLLRTSENGFKAGLIVIDPRKKRNAKHPRFNLRPVEFAHGLEPPPRCRSARFQKPRQLRIAGRHRDIDREPMAPRDASKQIQVPQDQIRFRRDVNLKARETSQHFKNGLGDLEMLFGGLIGIGCRADGDGLAVGASPAPKFAAQPMRRVALKVDDPLKIHGIVMFHVFVRVSGVAIDASELAAPVGVDGPLEIRARSTDPVES